MPLSSLLFGGHYTQWILILNSRVHDGIHLLDGKPVMLVRLLGPEEKHARSGIQGLGGLVTLNLAAWHLLKRNLALFRSLPDPLQ